MDSAHIHPNTLLAIYLYSCLKLRLSWAKKMQNLVATIKIKYSTEYLKSSISNEALRTKKCIEKFLI